MPYNGNIDDFCVIPKDAITHPCKLYVGVMGYGPDSILKITEWSPSVRVNKGCNEDISSSSSGGGSTNVPYADENTPGIMKLYKDSGNNSDGSVSQQKVTEGFRSIKFEVMEEDKECMLLNVDF